MMSMQIPNTDTMKFGPEWLQQMNENSGCAGTTPLSNKIIIPKSSVYSRTRLHGRQYGVEKLISIWSKMLAFPPELTACPDILVTDSSQIVSPVSMRTAMEIQKQQESSGQKQSFVRGRGSGTSSKAVDIPVRGGGTSISRGLGRRPGHTGMEDTEQETQHHGALRSISQSSNTRGRGRTTYRGGGSSHGHVSSSQPPSYDRGDGAYESTKNDEEECGGEEERDDSSGEWQQVGAGGRMRQISHNSIESGSLEATSSGDLHQQHPHAFTRPRAFGHPSQGGAAAASAEQHQGQSWRQRQRTKSGGDKQGPHSFQHSTATHQGGQQQRRTFYTPSNSTTNSTNHATRPDQHQRSYSGDSQYEGDGHSRHTSGRSHHKRSRTSSRTEDVVLEDFFEDAPGNPTNVGGKIHSQRRVHLAEDVVHTQTNCLDEVNEDGDELKSAKMESQQSTSAVDVGWLASQLKMLASTTGGIEKMDEEQLKEVLQRVLTPSDNPSESVKQKTGTVKPSEISGGSASALSISAPPNLSMSVPSNTNSVSPLPDSNTVKAFMENVAPPGADAPVHWFYLDPKGNEQGPFPSSSMWQWFENGYFPSTLRVKRSCDSQYLNLQVYKQLYRHSNPFLDTLPPPPLTAVPGVEGGKEWNSSSTSKEQPIYPTHNLHPSPSRYPPVTSTSTPISVHPTTMEATQVLNPPAAALTGQQLFSAFYSSSSAGGNARGNNISYSSSNDQIMGSAAAPGFRRSVSLTVPPPVGSESERAFTNPPTELALSNQSFSGLQPTTPTTTYPSGLAFNSTSIPHAHPHANVEPPTMKVHPSSRLLGGDNIAPGLQAEGVSGYVQKPTLPSVSLSSTVVPSGYLPAGQHSTSLQPNHLINRSFSTVVPSSIMDPVISAPSTGPFLPLSTSDTLNNVHKLNPPRSTVTQETRPSLDGLNPALRDFVTNNSIWSTGNATSPSTQPSADALFDLGGLVSSESSLLTTALNHANTSKSSLEDDDTPSLLPFVLVASNKKSKKTARDPNEERQKIWEDTYRQAEHSRLPLSLPEDEESQRLTAIQKEQEAAAVVAQRQRLEEEQRRLLTKMPELPQNARWGTVAMGRSDSNALPSLLSIQQAEQQQMHHIPTPCPADTINKASPQRPGVWSSSASVSSNITIPPISGKTLAEIQAEELRKEEARQQEERELAVIRENHNKRSVNQGGKASAPLWAAKVKQSLPSPSTTGPVSSVAPVNVVAASSSPSTPITSATTNASPIISIWGSSAPNTPAPAPTLSKQISLTSGPVSKNSWPGLVNASQSVENSTKSSAPKGAKAGTASNPSGQGGELDVLKNVIAQSRPTNPLTEWAKNRVRELFAGGNSGVLDLGTLIDITSDMPDEGEVSDMFKEYLGDSEVVRGFSAEFLERRREILRFGATPSGWVTAPSYKGSAKVSTNADKKSNTEQGGGVWQTASKTGNTASSAGGNANSGGKKKKKSQKMTNQSVRIL